MTLLEGFHVVTFHSASLSIRNLKNIRCAYLCAPELNLFVSSVEGTTSDIAIVSSTLHLNEELLVVFFETASHIYIYIYIPAYR